MMTGVTALLARSLRMDARSLLNHLARLGLMVAIYIALCTALAVAVRFGAPGMRFFRASVYLNAVFLGLMGIGSFSTTITEEKEEDTLGLILMAGIGPLGLLMGKLGGRLVQALLLVAVQYPFTLLAVTMGGVSQSQVDAAYVGLTSYMLMLAGVGLLCSTIASNNRRAGTWMVIALAAYVLIPFLCRELWSYCGFNRIGSQSIWSYCLLVVMSQSLFVQIESILTTGFGESPWSTQAISNGLIGLVCFALSWCCFGYATRSLGTEATSRGALARKQRGLARSFSPGRAWNNPFIWKDFHFVAGGLSMRLLRILFYAALFCFSWGLAELWGMRFGRNYWTHVMGIYQFFLMCALSWETALLAARCIHDEVRGQTLASLVMLPRSIVGVFYSKLFGAMLGAYPAFIVFVVANWIGLENTAYFLRPRDPGLFFIAHFLLVPHLAAVFALWVRWGAVPLAIGTMIGHATLWVVAIETLRLRDRALNTAVIEILILCAACHWLVLRSIRRIAERG